MNQILFVVVKKSSLLHHPHPALSQTIFEWRFLVRAACEYTRSDKDVRVVEAVSAWDRSWKEVRVASEFCIDQTRHRCIGCGSAREGEWGPRTIGNRHVRRVRAHEISTRPQHSPGRNSLVSLLIRIASGYMRTHYVDYSANPSFWQLCRIVSYYIVLYPDTIWGTIGKIREF